jgi:hypothetical protein
MMISTSEFNFLFTEFCFPLLEVLELAIGDYTSLFFEGEIV